MSANLLICQGCENLENSLSGVSQCQLGFKVHLTHVQLDASDYGMHMNTSTVKCLQLYSIVPYADLTSSIPVEPNTAYATTPSIPVEPNTAYATTPSIPVEPNTAYATTPSIPVEPNTAYATTPSIPVEPNTAYATTPSIPVEPNTAYATAPSIPVEPNTAFPSIPVEPNTAYSTVQHAESNTTPSTGDNNETYATVIDTDYVIPSLPNTVSPRRP